MAPERLIAALAELLERLQVRYAIVGSVASISYGEPRMTNDVDLVAELKPEHVPAFLTTFSGPEYYLSEAAMRSAIQQRFQFNIIHSTEGMKADVYLPSGTDLHQQLLARRVWLEVGESSFAWLASPEDVILGKLQYHAISGSAKHLRDIAGILRVNDRQVDVAYVSQWAEKIGAAETWQQILQSLAQDTPHGEQ